MSDDGVGDNDGDTDVDTDERSLRYHVDGDFVPAESASVSVTDRGFFYGDTAFRTLRAYGGEVSHWDTRTDRLVEVCDALGMDHGLFDDDLRTRIDEALVANDLGEAYVRLSVIRGSQGGRLTPTEAVDPHMVAIVEPLSHDGRGSDPVWDGSATVQTVETRHIPDRSLPAWAETHNYLSDVLACVKLRAAGADEVLMLDADGYITEGAISNPFFVNDDMFCTPSLDGPALPDTARCVVPDLARQKGTPIRERRFAPDDVHDANEAFLTNSTWELRPVETVDGIEVDNGLMMRLLSRLYDGYVERRHYGGGGGNDDTDNGGDADDVGGDRN